MIDTTSGVPSRVEAAPLGSAPAEDIRAEHVEISQGGAGSIDATTVSISQGGAGNVRATNITVSQGGIGVGRAERVELRGGSNAFAMVADEARFEGGSNVLLLISRKVDGEVRPLLDWRAAAALGAAFGAAVAILRRR